MKSLFAMLALGACSMLPAANILTVGSGLTTANDSLVAGAGVSFSITQSYTNVGFAAELFPLQPSENVTYYLTDAIGPAANASNVLASGTVAVPAASLFELKPASDGLALGPGTYYLILQSANVYLTFHFAPLTIAADTGAVAINSLFDGLAEVGPPYTANDFTVFSPTRGMHGFSFYGDAAPVGGGDVPEPSTWALMAAGGLALAALRRRR